MRTRLAALPLVVVFVVACSTNPVTGKREINLVSEQQEISMGRESHPQVLQQYGVYDEKPELTRLVNEVGQRLAASSERPNLPWTFTILDSPIVNAMALPGGYIYITRGMMERINSEDELAGVLGHEIAHVTARHAAQRISRAQLAQFGMLLGAVVAGPAVVQQYGQIAELGLNLLFQKYSRGQETQADLVGTEYIANARYNPVGAERMLMALQRLQKDELSSVERYFVSHPDPAKRVKDVRSKINELAAKAPVTTDEPNRTAYVRMLDGMTTGNSTKRTVIRGGTIYDRDHGIIIQAPSGWTATTAPGMLFAMEPAREGQQMSFIAQEVPARELQGANARDAIRNKLQQMGLRFVGTRDARSGSGENFPIDVWTGQTQGGQVGVESTQFQHGDHVTVFLFLAPGVSRSDSPLGDVLARMSMDSSRARSIEPPRMRVGTVRSGESWGDLARLATGNASDAEAVANFNGFDVSTRPSAGMVVKLPEEIVREG